MIDDKDAFTQTTLEELINLAEQIYVSYPRSNEILSKIKHCHQYSKTSA